VDIGCSVARNAPTQIESALTILCLESGMSGVRRSDLKRLVFAGIREQSEQRSEPKKSARLGAERSHDSLRFAKIFLILSVTRTLLRG
jgi:hypothetical protein